MNKESELVFDYYMRHPGFLEAIKELLPSETIYYMKKNIVLDEYCELSEVQINLFNTAMNNVDWIAVVSELERGTNIKGWIKKMKRYKISVSIVWSEEEIRDMIGNDEPFPPEDEIEEWMKQEMCDAADFEVIEDKK